MPASHIEIDRGMAIEVKDYVPPPSVLVDRLVRGLKEHRDAEARVSDALDALADFLRTRVHPELVVYDTAFGHGVLRLAWADDRTLTAELLESVAARRIDDLPEVV